MPDTRTNAAASATTKSAQPRIGQSADNDVMEEPHSAADGATIALSKRRPLKTYGDACSVQPEPAGPAITSLRLLLSEVQWPAPAPSRAKRRMVPLRSSATQRAPSAATARPTGAPA